MEVDIEWDEDIFLDAYQGINNAQADVKLFYGGRDSGKSYNITAIFVRICLSLPPGHFNCLLIRKTYNSIEESQYALIKNFIYKHGLEDLFTFGVSPLEITCINGNRFIAKGCDNPGKIKSLTNPTHAWYEEGNQLTQDDYTIVSTTLRSDYGTVEEWISFNPECDGDFRQFWLYKEYFSHTSLKSFTWTKIIDTPKGPAEKKVCAVHVTYLDNPHCTPDRAAKLEDLKKTSPYYYRIYCLGEWGIRENKSPAIVTFSRERHVGKVTRDYNDRLVQSWDINRNPMCCNIIQHKGNKIRFLETIKVPNTSTEKVCSIIALKYPNALWVVTGDYSGTQQSAIVSNADYNSHYKIVKRFFRLTDGQMQYMVNPLIEDNLFTVNWCLEHLDVLMDEDKCQPLIFDMEHAELMANGKLKKGDRKDPTQQLDSLDGARYFFNRYYGKLVRSPSKLVKGRSE